MSYAEIGKEIGELVQDRNKNYGNSFQQSGDIMRILFPNGIPPEKYTVVLALVRIIDKIFRLATNPNYNGENCWQDMAGYCILMLGHERNQKGVDTQPHWTKLFESYIEKLDEELMGNLKNEVEGWEYKTQ